MERLIDVPSLQEPPEDILRRLRAIDDRTDLYYVGGGEWWLGRVKLDSPRRLVGLKEMAALEEHSSLTVRPTYRFKIPATSWDRWKERHVPAWLRWLVPIRYREHLIASGGVLRTWSGEQQARLMMAGFGVVEQFVQPFPPDGRMVEYFRIQDFTFRHTPAHVLDRQVLGQHWKQAAHDAALWRMSDYLHTEGRWMYRRIMKHRAREMVTK